jgi:hypothetical protein
MFHARCLAAAAPADLQPHIILAAVHRQFSAVAADPHRKKLATLLLSDVDSLAPLQRLPAFPLGFELR